jgi:poly-gamma-glutamate synthesis protein (capsule biosynthesis protein)
MNESIIVCAVGDIGPNRKVPGTIFDGARKYLQNADICFCQLETNLSNKGTPMPQARLPMRSDPRSASAIKDAGFSVISFAGNHCMDWGSEAFFETMDTLKSHGIAVIGVGRNIAEARNPGIFECQGMRVAFLAYNSILPQCYWAEKDRPGCVPLRAWTHYEPIEHDQPGTPCRIHTFPHSGDLDAMVTDIRKAKAENDVVILSMHWGIHFVPADLADYQRIIAHTAIDHGADLILGHHPHILKGIEVYRDKIIFYSLGNFAIEPPSAFQEGLFESARHKEIEALNPNWQTDKAYAAPPDTRKTILVQCTISEKRVIEVGFKPFYINDNAVPEPLAETRAQFAEVVEYLLQISNDQGLDPHFSISEGQVIIHTGGSKKQN